MSAEDAPTGVPVTDLHRKLVFSFIRMLKDVKTESSGNLDGVAHCLGHEFGIDAAGVGGIHDADIDLLEVFQNALAEKEKKASPENDEKFASFVELLKKKGYFNGVEPDTSDYQARMQKAREKYNQRNNPYEDLTADQLKSKGNELMGQAKYKDAIAYYTKAIEIEPTNHIFYANRAAAHTHTKDYRSAIIDCEKAISINESYSKAYSRLGTALFYDGNYVRAVDAYTKACELEPENETYKADLRQAEEKLKVAGATAGAGAAMNPFGGMNPFAGAGGAGGMPDFGQMSQMMNNPQFMQMASQMMQNPDFNGMIMNMAKNMGMGNMFSNPEEMQRFMQNPTERRLDADGNLVTPFGKMNPQALEEFQRSEVEGNPKLAAIMEDVKVNGFAAFQKYMGDPDVMNLMMKFQNTMMGQ